MYGANDYVFRLDCHPWQAYIRRVGTFEAFVQQRSRRRERRRSPGRPRLPEARTVQIKAAVTPREKDAVDELCRRALSLPPELRPTSQEVAAAVRLGGLTSLVIRTVMLRLAERCRRNEVADDQV